MTGGTLVVSREIELHQHYKKRLKEFGFNNFEITAVDKDGLTMMIYDMQPKLVLIEASFYERSTPYMLSRLLDDFPGLNIAVVNLYKFPVNKAARFIFNGVQSYVNKFEGYDEFIKGLKIVRDGKKYISPVILEIINLLGELPKPVDRITLRENEVLQEFCTGKKENDIKNNLHISLRTLHKHRERLYRAFDVDNRVDLFWVALSAGLVDFENSFYLTRK